MIPEIYLAARLALSLNIPYCPTQKVSDFTDCNGTEYKINYIKKVGNQFIFITKSGEVKRVEWYNLHFETKITK